MKNTDKNESEIVKALRSIPGIGVQTGHDDCLVGFRGKTFWFEIKNPDAVRKDGTPYRRKNCKTYQKQKKLLDNWPGHYEIVTTLDQILKRIGVL